MTLHARIMENKKVKSTTNGKTIENKCQMAGSNKSDQNARRKYAKMYTNFHIHILYHML